jgi:tetratricopeptide (TPR) repeat protein
MLDKSIEVRQRLISEYPGSKFVPDCIYANAEAQEAIGDFAQAASTYEAYVRGYEARGEKPVARAAPKRGKGKNAKAEAPERPAAPQKWDESKAQVALFNAATYRDGLGQYKEALANRERFLELWPKSKDAEQVTLSITELLEKTGNYTKAMAKLEEYERDYNRWPSKVLNAEGRIASMFEKLQKPRDVQRLYKRIWEYYEQVPKSVRGSLEPSALTAVGRAHFLTVEEDYNFYSRMKLSWGRPASPEAFKASIAEKNKSRDWVERKYVTTVSIGAPEPAICALLRIGLTYDNFVDKLVNAPMPPGVDEETAQNIRDEFSNQSQPIRAKATEAFSAAVMKSRELSVFNDCAAQALQKLRTVYAPDQFPEMPEDTVALKKGSELAIGGDLLTTIQDVPPPVAAAVPEKQAQDKALQEDLTDLTQRLRQQTATDVNAPAPAKAKKDGEAKKKSDSEEPEDFL